MVGGIRADSATMRSAAGVEIANRLAPIVAGKKVVNRRSRRPSACDLVDRRACYRAGERRRAGASRRRGDVCGQGGRTQSGDHRRPSRDRLTMADDFDLDDEPAAPTSDSVRPAACLAERPSIRNSCRRCRRRKARAGAVGAAPQTRVLTTRLAHIC